VRNREARVLELRGNIASFKGKKPDIRKVISQNKRVKLTKQKRP